MTPNETARILTDKRAQELNGVYKKIIDEKPYNNFKMAFKPFPIPEIEAKWKLIGKPLSDFVEPVDGFHPSQEAQSAMADDIWEWLEKEHPEALGDINPHNDLIEMLFGDQGGY